jgi:uncharacterized protein (TIGR02996 family)
MSMSRDPLLRGALIGLLLSAGLATSAFAAGPSFDEVMAEPDSPTLNLAFARSEDEAGQLLSATGALERVLLVQPDDHQARLLYADVLHRLGDDQGASRQLTLLDTVQLTPAQQAEKERYRGALGRRSR